MRYLSTQEREVVDKFNEIYKTDTEYHKRYSDYSSYLKSSLSNMFKGFKELSKISEEISGVNAIMATEKGDKEMVGLLREEVSELEKRKEEFEERILRAFLKESTGEREKALMEIRAGTGGDEAALFASELMDMYQNVGRLLGWKFEVYKATPSKKILKEGIVHVEGRGVYQLLAGESGVHRVQRIPATETSGRVHTSTVTVAVLEEVDQPETNFNMNDFKTETKRATGAGGQHVNKTDSAVKMTHIPTGLSVFVQQEREQLRNRAIAFRVLTSRLQEIETRKRIDERNAKRSAQVQNGFRSEKMRTYNYAQNRVSDHRVNWTTHHLDTFMTGSDETVELLRLLFLNRIVSDL